MSELFLLKTLSKLIYYYYYYYFQKDYYLINILLNIIFFSALVFLFVCFRLVGWLVGGGEYNFLSFHSCSY